MKEIAAAIHEGAQAFLMSEYKILVIFIVVVFVAVGFATAGQQLSASSSEHSSQSCRLLRYECCYKSKR